MDELRKKWFVSSGHKPRTRRVRTTRHSALIGATRLRGSGRGRLPSYRTRVRRGISKQIGQELIREAEVALLGATWRHSARREAVFALLDGRQTTFKFRQQHLYVDDVVSVDSESDSGTNSVVASSSRCQPTTTTSTLPWTQQTPVSDYEKQSKEPDFDTVALAAVRELDFAGLVSENVLKNAAKRLKRFAQTLAHGQTLSSNCDEATDKTDAVDRGEEGVVQCRSLNIPMDTDESIDREKKGAMQRQSPSVLVDICEGIDSDEKIVLQCRSPIIPINKSGGTDKDENGIKECRSPSMSMGKNEPTEQDEKGIVERRSPRTTTTKSECTGQEKRGVTKCQSPDTPTCKNAGMDQDEKGLMQSRSSSIPIGKSEGTDRDEEGVLQSQSPDVAMGICASTDRDEKGVMQSQSPGIAMDICEGTDRDEKSATQSQSPSIPIDKSKNIDNDEKETMGCQRLSIPIDKNQGMNQKDKGVLECGSPRKPPTDKTEELNRDEKNAMQWHSSSILTDEREEANPSEHGVAQYDSPSVGVRRTAAYRAHAMKWLYHLVEKHGEGRHGNSATDTSIVKDMSVKSGEKRSAIRTLATDGEAFQFVQCNALPSSLAHIVKDAAEKEIQALLKFMVHPDESVAKCLVQTHGGAWNAARAQLDETSIVAVYGNKQKEGNISGIIPRIINDSFSDLQAARQASFPDFIRKIGTHAMRPTEDEILQAYHYVRHDTQGFQVVWRLLNLVCGVTEVHQRDAVSVTANLLKGIDSCITNQNSQILTDNNVDSEVKALWRLAHETVREICQRVTHFSFDDAMAVKRYASSFVPCEQ